jgi:hypothetical protein
VAKKTIVKFIEKTSRLYEQECCAALAATALERCVKRWVQWMTSGQVLPNIVLPFGWLGALTPAPMFIGTVYINRRSSRVLSDGIG